MGSFSLIHWIILGIIILLLFGGNRFSSMMSDVAKGLKSFKQGLSEDDKPADPPRLPPQKPVDLYPAEPNRAEPVSPPPPPPGSDDPPRA